MSGVVTNLKRFFNRNSEEKTFSPFRSVHFLNSLSHSNLSEILLACQQQHFLSLVPELSEKKTLLISSPGTRIILERVLKKNPFRLFNYQLTPFTPVMDPRLITVTGSYQSPALKPSVFNLALLPCAGMFQSDFISSISGITASLANQGRLVLAMIHPMLSYILTNQNSASNQRSQHTLQGVFSKLRDLDLYIESIGEGTVDRDLRSYFVDSVGHGHFDDYQGLPLVLLIRAVKFVR